MNWLKRWIERDRIKTLKLKISQMKVEAKAAEDDCLMLSACTISSRIALLEAAVKKIELQQNTDLDPPPA
jgi:uncharacterized small protein (DUF1192 family)